MIDKLEEFAVNGDKSITGLNLTTGFPRQQKPFRQWMNYLFNWSTVKLNEVIDEVNAVNIRFTPLLQPIKVGEIFVTTNDYTTAAQVAVRHGYGTWQRFAEGRTLVGYSSTTANGEQYRIMGNQFGANTHKLTVAEMPNHNHTLPGENTSAMTGGGAAGGTVTTQKPTSYSGGDQPHNNIQPSIVVAYWLRTA